MEVTGSLGYILIFVFLIVAFSVLERSRRLVTTFVV
jgi:hypothetical protein